MTAYALFVSATQESYLSWVKITLLFLQPVCQIMCSKQKLLFTTMLLFHNTKIKAVYDYICIGNNTTSVSYRIYCMTALCFSWNANFNYLCHRAETKNDVSTYIKHHSYTVKLVIY